MYYTCTKLVKMVKNGQKSLKLTIFWTIFATIYCKNTYISKTFWFANITFLAITVSYLRSFVAFCFPSATEDAIPLI